LHERRNEGTWRPVVEETNGHEMERKMFIIGVRSDDGYLGFPIAAAAVVEAFSKEDALAIAELRGFTVEFLGGAVTAEEIRFLNR